MFYYLYKYDFYDVYYNGTINGTRYVCTNLDMYFENRKRKSWWNDFIDNDSVDPPNIYCYRLCNGTNANETYYTDQYDNLTMYSNSTHLSNATMEIDGCMDDNVYYNQSLPIFAYEYEKMSSSVINITWFIVLAVCAAISLCIAIVFFIKTKQDHNSRKNTKKKRDKLTETLTSLCIASHTTTNLLYLCVYYNFFIQYDRDWAWRFNVSHNIGWMISKVLLYSVFMYRFSLLSKASMDGMSKKRRYALFGCFIFLIVVLVVAQTVYIIEITSYYSMDWWKVPENVYNSRKENFLIAAWIVIALDVVIALSLGLLMVHTILQLVVLIQKHDVGTASEMSKTQTASASSSKSFVKAVRESHKINSKQMGLIHLTTKICLTTFLSVLSSLIWSCFWLSCEQWENYDVVESYYIFLSGAFTNIYLYSIGRRIYILWIMLSIYFAFILQCRSRKTIIRYRFTYEHYKKLFVCSTNRKCVIEDCVHVTRFAWRVY